VEWAIDGPGAWDPLGVTLDAAGANVALWAPGADSVDLCLFDDDGEEHRVRLPEQTFGVFHGHVAGIVAGAAYGFRVWPVGPPAGCPVEPAQAAHGSLCARTPRRVPS